MLQQKLQGVRSKVVDDILRNRQLAARGKAVFVATKEDLYGWGHLDELARQVLSYARVVHGIDVSEFEKTLDDTSRKADRQAILDSLLPHGAVDGNSYGCM
jgi:hypothetical protein